MISTENVGPGDDRKVAGKQSYKLETRSISNLLADSSQGKE